ncbi:MAG: phosphomethylpyrimidine synthase ThiC [Elusimicrobiota bacterium]|nr:phosphomethylpyrimidine synthase ThiC [Elusimicrobiota bacterium]
MKEIIKKLAALEGVKEKVINEKVSSGRAVIPLNFKRKDIKKPVIIGEGFTVKVNANIGGSPGLDDTGSEVDKLLLSVKAGADTVMDLTIGKNWEKILRRVLERSEVPVGTVPVYAAVCSPNMALPSVAPNMALPSVAPKASVLGLKNFHLGTFWNKCVRAEKLPLRNFFRALSHGRPRMALPSVAKKRVADIKSGFFIDIIRRQAEMGVDFMTIHAGITQKTVELYDKSERLGGIVSRGGKLIYRWVSQNGKENPLYEQFDEILDIAKKHNVTLSLGDGMRPGAIADASDSVQFAELDTLGELTRRCRESGVGVMVEGPGHVPLDKIEENVLREKEVTGGAPFYVLGPLTTDIGAGYDHITGAIGGALAAFKGADFLCYVTPAEHMHLPDSSDVVDGVVASKIAAHSADIAKGNKAAIERDRKMSEARRNLDWDKMKALAIYPGPLEETFKKYSIREDRACTMCGQYCALLDK